MQVHESDQVTVPFSFLGTAVEGPYLRPDVKQVEHAHEMTLVPVCALGVEMQGVSRLEFDPSNDAMFCKHPPDNLGFLDYHLCFFCGSEDRRCRSDVVSVAVGDVAEDQEVSPERECQQRMNSSSTGGQKETRWSGKHARSAQLSQTTLGRRSGKHVPPPRRRRACSSKEIVTHAL